MRRFSFPGCGAAKLRFAGPDLPFGPVLVFLAILTCLLLLGHVREVSQRRTAEEKGLALLKQWLSPAQLTQYEKYHCFGPEGELPLGDMMLAQKIALENDEEAALALA